MRKLIILAILYAATAAAATAFKTGERVTGLTKQCFYEFAGSQYTLTIRAFELCPLSIEVNP